MSENEDSLFFNSDFFDEDLFENMRIQKKSEKATKTQKLELLEFIGGFEKWEFLPDDCKMYVIGFLNYWTRCQLSLCSKKDNQIVKNTILCVTEGVSPKNNGIIMRPRNLAALCKSDYEQNNREQAAVHKIVMKDTTIQMHTTTNFIRSWRFYQPKNSDHCFVTSKSVLEPDYCYSSRFQISNSNSQKEYEKIVKKVMKKAERNVKTLEVDWKTNPEGLEIEKLDKLKYLKMNFWKSESVEFWLSRLNSEIALEEIILQCWEVLNFEQLDYPSILNAASFFVPENIVMSDEQFLRMSNRKSLFRADTLSSKVLMEFVRKWVDDEIREDFEQLTVWTKKNFVKEIFENLDSYNFNVVQYDYGRWNIPLYREFFSHFEKFGYYGKFWQFSKRNDPFNSISLLITRQNFVVLRTGFPCFKNGRQDVKLVFPEDILFCNIYF
ncbi:hypothetical protein L5515_006846 [Caenorhabditis briggsae]|uniref:F-box domain-containing protein n=1 Tax=Caenorhabditis briggsae TaxID=6238 RepID=A0AAE9JJA4_CAEBR|nr:hypothetical protein L5515_006846 [Caenorhabditis briggsae]